VNANANEVALNSAEEGSLVFGISAKTKIVPEQGHYFVVKEEGNVTVKSLLVWERNGIK